MIKIGFEVETDEGVAPPSATGFVTQLSQSLPKEWWADHREDSWGIVAIYPLNGDGTLQQSDTRLRPSGNSELHKTITRLKAELAQERKLTARLDGQVEALELSKSGMAGAVQGQKRRIELLVAENGHNEDLVSNLREKNDNQAASLGTMLQRERDLQKKYDDSLILIEQMQRKTKAWTVQDNDSVATIRRMRNQIEVWARKYEDADSLNRDLVVEREGLTEQVKADTTTITRLSLDLEGCRASNLTYIGERKVEEEMIAKIVDAMQGAGYDISGWGNDEELTELEALADAVEDAGKQMYGALDTIRTRR